MNSKILSFIQRKSFYILKNHFSEFRGRFQLNNLLTLIEYRNKYVFKSFSTQAYMLIFIVQNNLSFPASRASQDSLTSRPFTSLSPGLSFNLHNIHCIIHDRGITYGSTNTIAINNRI